MKQAFTLFIALCISFCASAQTDSTKKVAAPKKLPNILLFDFVYGVQLPGGNMKEDFIVNFLFGGRVSFYTATNWWVAFNGEFQFFDDLKTDVVAPLRNVDGYIINKIGHLATVQLGQRGFLFGGMAGKLVPFAPAKNPRFGIDFGIGGGYMQHWIKIRVTDKNIVQLQGDYKKGYDRMTSGFATQQYIGLRYLGKKKLFNTFIGFDFIQGFTQNRRAFNYDTGLADTRHRVDLLFGMRIGLSLPIYIHSAGSIREEKVQYY